MSLFAGHVADSHDRRRIALWALSVLVLCSVGLWWLAHPAPIGDVALTAPAQVILGQPEPRQHVKGSVPWKHEDERRHVLRG